MTEQEKQEKIKRLRATIAMTETGFGGVLPNGNIVDRREHPNAIPFQENKMFNLPKPKKLK